CARAGRGRWRGAQGPKGTGPPPQAGAAASGARVIDRALRTEPVPQVSPDGRYLAYVRDDGKGPSELRVLDARQFRVLRTHRVNAEVSYDWLGDTLVVAQLEWTSRWRVYSDLYRWLPVAGGGCARRPDVDARERAALRHRPDGVPAGLSLAGPDGRRAAHGRAARRPGAGGAARWLVAVRDPRGRGLGVAARGRRGWAEGATCRPAGTGRSTCSVRRGAARRDARDGVRGVACAAATFLAAAVSRCGAERAVLGRRHGWEQCCRPVQLHRGGARGAATVPRDRVVRGVVEWAGQPDARRVGVE